MGGRGDALKKPEPVRPVLLVNRLRQEEKLLKGGETPR